ncbi:hypothetical protein GGF44_004984 [Coemansia sp. RSA 1694]|nr:hypothetical protein GGF44_004984 [Coemansia sp. RSA 1694]
MERVFHDLDRNRFDHAYAAAHSLAMDRGKNLALARGYHGILVACLREIELDQMGAETDRCSSSSSPHVFRLCESVQFLLSKDVYEMPTKHTLREAEKNLALALKLDQGNTYFIAFYAQVLIALDELPMAKKMLEKWYSTEKALTCLRMLMSIDPREVIHQTEYILDYLKLDPFASQATYFEPFMAMTLSRLNSLDRESLLMVTDIVINRIELGDAEESCAWECLALLLSYLRKNNQGVIDEVLGRRLAWWRDTYFASDYFLRTKESDLTVYMAVCAQQLLDLEAGHPVYALLSGKLSTDHAEFVNAHIRI